MLKLDVSNISPRSDREATAGTLFQFIVYRNKKRVCHKSVTHPFLFFAFSQIRNL